jgi:hypothetical protein
VRYETDPIKNTTTEAGPYTVAISRGGKTRTVTARAGTPLEAKVDLGGSDEIVLTPVVMPATPDDRNAYWRLRAEKAWADRTEGRLGKWFDSNTDD